MPSPRRMFLNPLALLGLTAALSSAGLAAPSDDPGPLDLDPTELSVPADPTCANASPAVCIPPTAAEPDLLTIAYGDRHIEIVSTWEEVDAGVWRSSNVVDFGMGGIDIPVPLVAAHIEVGCGAAFYVSVDGGAGAIPLIEDRVGSANLADVFDHIDHNPSGITFDPPLSALVEPIEFGFSWGDRLRDIGVLGPINPCRLYLYFDVRVGGTTMASGDVSVTLGKPNRFSVLLDPADPAFSFGFRSALVSDATAGVVKGLGAGFSNQGTLYWKSVIPLWIGGDKMVDMTAHGHFYADGKFGLIPIPEFPINISVDGEALVGIHDLTISDTVIDLFTGEMLRQKMAALKGSDDNPGLAFLKELRCLLHRLTIAINARAINLDIKILSLTLARGAIILDRGDLYFGSESGTPQLGKLGETGNVRWDRAATVLNQMRLGIKTKVHGFIRGILTGEPAVGLRMNTAVTFGSCHLAEATVYIDTTQDDPVHLEAAALTNGEGGPCDFTAFKEALFGEFCEFTCTEDDACTIDPCAKKVAECQAWKSSPSCMMQCKIDRNCRTQVCENTCARFECNPMWCDRLEDLCAIPEKACVSEHREPLAIGDIRG